MSTTRTPVAVGAAVAVCAAVVLTGCASNNLHLPGPLSAGSASPPPVPTISATASNSPSTGTTPTLDDSAAPVFTTPTPTPSGPQPLSGAAMKALLPTPATLPHGWTMKADTEVDSGDAFRDETDKPTLSDHPCTWLGNASGTTLGLDYQAAQALADASDGDNESQIVLNSYFPGTATKMLAGIRAYADKCKSYTGRDWGDQQVPVTVTVTPVPNLGDEALDLKNVPKGPYAVQEVLAVRVRDTVLFLDGNTIVERMPHFMDLAVPMTKHLQQVVP
ncbi:hypothetical protein [Kitasatospora sp. NPDC056531]|uniref:hypothetical protein n=1 Tax=Kitasatospora sp. NPDC056531 TaxID=3345856 RepID=UPI003686506F